MNCPRPKRLRQEREDLQVGSGVSRRRSGRAPVEQAPLEVGHRALLLGPLARREDDVRALGRLGQKEIGHDEQIQLVKPGLERARIRHRNDEVRPHD